MGQKNKKAAAKKDQMSELLTSTSTIQTQSKKALVEIAAPPNTCPLSKEGWDIVIDKKSKAQAVLAPSVAALLKRKESLEVHALPTAAPSVVDDKIEPSATVDVKVDSNKLGVVIGPAGETIKLIQEVTCTKVDIPETDFTKFTVIAVTGTDSASVQKAKSIIIDLCSKGYSAFLEGTDFQENTAKVPLAQLHEIIGKGGSVISTIQKTLNVKLNIPDTKEPGNKKVAKITIAGPKAGVAEAKAVIKCIVSKHYHPLTHPGVTDTEVDVPASLYNIVIGPRGSSIKHIQNMYDVKVHIPNAASSTDKVVVVGTVGGVQRAKKHIKTTIDRAIAADEEQGSWGNVEEEEGQGHYESWMDEYAPPRRCTGAQWA